MEMWSVIFLLIGLHCGRGRSQFPSSEEILHPTPLVYPYGGFIKVVLGIAAPVKLAGRVLVYTQNFQFQWPLPQNATYFTEHFRSLRGRRKRSTSAGIQRKIFYHFLEQELQRWGGDGKSCVMKSICEASETPLEGEGLVDNLLNVILTPDYGKGPSSVDDNYLRAAEAGRRGDDCSIIYSDCPEGYGLLERISRIHSTNFDQ